MTTALASPTPAPVNRPEMAPTFAPILAGLSPDADHPLDFDFLVYYLRGVCQDLLKWSYKRTKVLAALISHANTEHDLAWPGIECLVTESKTSDRTVKRAMADLKEHGLLEVLDNREVPRPGPGQHNYEGERRSEKRLPTNNYLLSALAKLLPVALIERLAALLDLARRRDQPSKSDLPREAKANPDSSDLVAESTMRRSGEEYSGPDLDPFASADAESTSRASSASTSVCSVVINTASAESLDPPGATRSVARTARSGSDSGAPAGQPFQRSAARPAPGSGVLGAKSGPYKIRGIDAARAGQSALQGIGVSRHVARQIVENPPPAYRERGSLFALLLAAFARQSEVRGLVRETKAAYAYGVWKQWQKGDGEWLDWFRPTLRELDDRESGDSDGNPSWSATAEPWQCKTIESPPPLVSPRDTPKQELTPGPVDLSHLPPDQRAAIEQRAIEETLKRYTVPAVRARIEREGTACREVQTTLQDLLKGLTDGTD